MIHKLTSFKHRGEKYNAFEASQAIIDSNKTSPCQDIDRTHYRSTQIMQKQKTKNLRPNQITNWEKRNVRENQERTDLDIAKEKGLSREDCHELLSAFSHRKDSLSSS